MVFLPYLTWAKSPTTMSATGIWMTFPFRTTVNFCSCSIRLCRPRNCFSFDQSLKAVTRTTHTTDNKIAAPSIQPVSASPSSSAPPETFPHAGEGGAEGWLVRCFDHYLSWINKWKCQQNINKSFLKLINYNLFFFFLISHCKTTGATTNMLSLRLQC